MLCNTTPTYMLKDLNPDVVHHMTGHVDIFSLLEVVIVIFGCNRELITRKESKLTWLD